MNSRKGASLSAVALTDSQFKDLHNLLQSYLKVVAIGAIHDISEKELEKNAWLLYLSGFRQEEMAKILHCSQSTISRALSGKLTKQKGIEEVRE